MQTSRPIKLVVAIFLSLICVGALLGFVFPGICSTEVTYFDRANAMLKREVRGLFGKVDETVEPSKLARFYEERGFPAQQPVWEKAFEQNRGVMGLFRPQNVSYRFGRIVAKISILDTLFEQAGFTQDQKEKAIDQLRTLMQSGDSVRLHDYFKSLEAGSSG